MQIVQLVLANPLKDAIHASGFLATWLNQSDLTFVEQVEPNFEVLGEAIEALPPTIANLNLMCYFRNRLQSSRKLVAGGEWGAAVYELRELHNKLARLVV